MDIKSLLGLLLFFPTVSNAIEIPVLETFFDSIALLGRTRPVYVGLGWCQMSGREDGLLEPGKQNLPHVEE